MVELKDKELEQVDGGIWFKPVDGQIRDVDLATSDGLVLDSWDEDKATPKGWE